MGSGLGARSFAAPVTGGGWQQHGRARVPPVLMVPAATARASSRSSSSWEGRTAGLGGQPDGEAESDRARTLYACRFSLSLSGIDGARSRTMAAGDPGV